MGGLCKGLDRGVARIEGEHTALQRHDGMALGAEGLHEGVHSVFGIDGVAAGKDINGCISIFGPGVDAEMGLSDGDDARHALGTELMEGVSDDRCPNTFRRVQQRLPYRGQVVQNLRVTLPKLQKNMCP